MKNKKLGISIFLLTLICTACNKENVPINTDKPLNAIDPFQELRTKIEVLNKDFLGDKQLQRFYEPLLHRLTAEGLLELQPVNPFFPESWNCNDVDGYARQLAKDKGKSDTYAEDAARVASSACRNEQNKPKAELIRSYEVNIDGLKLFYPEKIDPLYPINFGQVYLGNHQALESGILHNLVIQELYMENPDYIFEDIYTIADKLCEMSIRMGLSQADTDPYEIADLVEQIMPDLLLPISENKYQYLNSKYNTGEEGLITGLYISYVSQLSGAMAVKYTQDFVNIVLTTGIPEDSEYKILATVSTIINSRFLWNMELPNPMENSFFICYSLQTDSWGYLTTEQYIIKYTAGDVDLWGIPKFDHDGNMFAVIFYNDYEDYLPFNREVFNTLLVNKESYSAEHNSGIVISNEYTKSNTRIADPIVIESALYPVYTLYDESIFVISFE